MNKKPLAIVTMVYNEGLQLARWVRHYTQEVDSLSDLYVINHGSTDGSIDYLPPKINVTNLGRLEGNGLQSWRANYVSNYVNKLNEIYNIVIHIDCDEYLVVDPDIEKNLLCYFNSTYKFSTHAIGFDVLHNVSDEPPLALNKISEVRRYIQFVGAMCKPVVSHASHPMKWVSGFHLSNIFPKFNDLYLFHGRYSDLESGLKRLSVTRELFRPETAQCSVDHQKIDDSVYMGWLESWLKLPKSDEDISNPICSIRSYLNNIKFVLRSDGIYSFDYSFRSHNLFKIPDKFIGRF